MTVTMTNPVTGITVTGVNEKYINRWKLMGFIVESYDSEKITMFKRVS